MPMRSLTPLLALLLAVAPVVVRAEPFEAPLVIPFQGRLLDSADQPVSGTRNVTFTLYTHATPPESGSGQTDDSVWTETHSVTVDRGLFSVQLGTTAAIDPAKLAGNRFLSMRLADENIELLPRLRVGSVPYALVATRAGRADVAAALDPAACQGCVAGTMLADGSVGAKKLGTLGSGSGVDADKLDGLDSSDFLLKTEVGSLDGYLRVGANATAQQGDAAATGTISAAAFLGDGSALTGVNASSVGGTSLANLLTKNDLATLASKSDLTAYAKTTALPSLDGLLRLTTTGTPPAQDGSATITGTLKAAALAGSGAAITGVDAAKLGGTAASEFVQQGGPLRLQALDATQMPCTTQTRGAIFFDPQSGGFAGCTGTKLVRFATTDLSDGATADRAGFSCQQIRAAGNTTSGVRWINLGEAEAFPTYCDMTTDGGGWTLVHKINSGLAFNASDLWNGAALNEMTTDLLTTAQKTANYQNRIVQNFWNKRGLTISQVRVHLYTGGQLKRELVFNAAGSDKLNWFDRARLTSSPWSDLASATLNFFGIAGDGGIGRNWFINRSYGGCPADVGWLVVQSAGTTAGCAWETRFGAPVSIMASTTGSAENITTGSYARYETMMVFVR